MNHYQWILFLNFLNTIHAVKRLKKQRPKEVFFFKCWFLSHLQKTAPVFLDIIYHITFQVLILILILVYLLTQLGRHPVAVHIYTKPIHRATQITTEQHKYNGRVRAVPCLCEFYPGICLTTKEKHGKTSVRVRKTSVRLKTPQSQYSIHIIKNTHTLQTLTNT